MLILLLSLKKGGGAIITALVRYCSRRIYGFVYNVSRLAHVCQYTD